MIDVRGKGLMLRHLLRYSIPIKMRDRDFSAAPLGGIVEQTVLERDIVI
jgi:hypothetical protein